jgi:predicted Zn-dependent protease with MMP-like domain
MTPARWEKLKARAEATVEATLAELPPEILEEAKKVPVILDRRCKEDPEILGQYNFFEPGEVSAANGPILLYLEAIDEFCLDEGADFEEEVKLTYLHELGHHLGWDEGDLEERGLD